MATLDVLLARARSVKSIAAATAAAACRGPVTPPQYVALGDSYAAAQGGSDYVDKECLESAKAYPYLLDPKMRIDLRVNAACTGASTSNVSDMISLGQLSELNEDTELVTLTVGAADLGLSRVLAACTAVPPTECRLKSTEHLRCW